MLTQARLKELLEYTPETGAWTWLADRTGGIRAGDRAGWLDRVKWYWRLSVDGVRYRSSRAAFLYMTGHWPNRWAEHVDCDTGNDKWENLREVSRSPNMRKVDARLEPGGHYYNRRLMMWEADVRVKGVRRVLGHFHTSEEAHSAYQQWVRNAPHRWLPDPGQR